MTENQAKNSPSCRMPRVVWTAVLALLVAHAILAWRNAAVTGPTHDEPAHLIDGYAALTEWDFTLNPEHPPLAKMWAALPLVFMDIPSVATIDYRSMSPWDAAETLFFSQGSAFADRIMGPSRAMVILVSLMLGVAIFLWSRSMWGWAGGLHSLALFALSPNFAGHAPIIHNDIAACLGFVLLGSLMWSKAQGKGWRRAILIGLALGYTLIVKFSGMLVVPLAGAWLFLARAENEPQSFRSRILRRVGQCSAAMAIAWLATVLIYGFPPDVTAYIRGIGSVYRRIVPDYEFFLMGQRDPDGFLFYFPLAIAFKTPLWTLAAWVVSLLCIRCSNWKRAAAALIPAIWFLGAAMAMAANIGVRYAFPVYVFLFVFAGIWLNPKLGALRLRAIAGAALIAGLAWTSWRTPPGGIAFFNAGVGGPELGIRYLDDSNLDWGQAIPATVEAMKKVEGAPLFLAWRNPIGPANYEAPSHVSMEERPEQAVAPEPGVFFISAQLLTLHRLPGEPGLRFRWLERYEPREILDGSVYVFEFRHTNPGESPGYDSEKGINRVDPEALLRNGIEELREAAVDYRNENLTAMAAELGIQLAYRLQAEERFDEMIEVLERARLGGHREAEAAAGLALAHAITGNLEKAMIEYQRLTKIDPDNPHLPVLRYEIRKLENRRSREMLERL